MSDRVAIVTGASRGIGQAIAEQLARDGMLVVINYHQDATGAEQVMERITAANGRAVLRPFDVSEQEQVAAGVKAIHREFGVIDVLVNNAGIPLDEPFLRAKKPHWDRMLAVNLSGVYHCCHAVVKTWAGARCGSRIVNVASLAGIKALRFSVAYSASKAGVIGFTKALALELAPKQVTVNAVAPGFIDTSRTPDAATDDYVRDYILQTPMQRLGTSREVAHLVSFLVSEAAGYITGEVIRVDGGLGL